jgi:uncharacterized protein
VELLIAGIGLVVGLLVGLTGVGGGSLLTPVLVVVGVPIASAVGTDLVYNIGTKLMGTIQHVRQHAVDWRWAFAVAGGGVPMAVIGSLVAGALRHDTVLLEHILGGALVLAAVSTIGQEVVRWYQRRRKGAESAVEPAKVSPLMLVPLGAAIGFLVGLTSIGAGSLVAPALLLWSGLTARRVVGTDVGTGLFLTAAAGFAHATIGTVNWHLVLNLMVGSVPGAWLGSRLTVVVPGRPLKTAVAGLVFLSGLKMF